MTAPIVKWQVPGQICIGCGQEDGKVELAPYGLPDGTGPTVWSCAPCAEPGGLKQAEAPRYAPPNVDSPIRQWVLGIHGITSRKP